MMNIFNTSSKILIEVLLRKSSMRVEQIQEELKEPIRKVLEKSQSSVNVAIPITIREHGEVLGANIESVIVEMPSYGSNTDKIISQIFETSHSAEEIIFHFYRPHHRNVEVETVAADGDSEEIPASNHWLLPSNSFVGLWENLIYEDGLKEKILDFALSALVFSQHNVNQNIISCNRLILLHGPPGTGKTSLCKAIAQKLSIRLHAIYKFTHLIEINSHSLFSKWFSESGKLVMKLFTKIREIVTQPESLVCVLIDEVESIAYARDEMSGQEPKDAMRVVNALLTQLDSIKEYPNVLILATSNLASTIDLAFLDRADIKQHVGLPSARAIYKIYSSMLEELSRVGLLQRHVIFPFEQGNDSNTLADLAKQSVGLSGRTIRKLPFLAHAFFVSAGGSISEGPIPINTFLKFMHEALKKHMRDQDCLQ